MIDRRTLVLGAGGALAATRALASPFSHVGPQVALPTVSQALRGVLQTSDAPAVGYAVIDAKGVSRLEVGGRRRSTAETPVGRDDAWHLGSNTEALTSAAYARLVEARQALWGVGVDFLFPDIKSHPDWRGATIESFLSHRAGVSDLGLINADFFKAVNKDRRPLQIQRTDLVSKVLSAPPQGKPKDYEYANLNYVIVGAAIERATRTTWEEAVDALVFKPLSLETAGFGAPYGDAPWGHEVGANGVVTPVDPADRLADNPPVLAPGGQAHMSLPDYAKFVHVFLSSGGGFLSPASLMRLARPADAFSEGDAMGWRVTPAKAWAKGPVLAHEGSNTLWRAYAELAPARPLGLLVVTNVGGEPGARAVQLMSARLMGEVARDD